MKKGQGESTMTTTHTIFIVDDDDGAVASVAALMTSVGYAVETFGSAEAFLASYDGQRPGCLILDVGLPGMSGLELFRKLSDEGNHIPTILVRGYMSGNPIDQNVADHVVACLEKPYHGDALCEVVRNALARL